MFHTHYSSEIAIDIYEDQNHKSSSCLKMDLVNYSMPKIYIRRIEGTGDRNTK